MHDDDLQALFRADLHRLRERAPPPAPAWRLLQAARTRAAQRMARQLRWTWRIAIGLIVLAAVPVLLHEPRALPGLVVPLLLGALVCWREEPGAVR